MTDRLVVVSAGTYHLPFDRLSRWTQEWLTGRAGVHVIVQHGASMPVPGAENHTIVAYAQLLEWCRQADAVVLQGGAGGVMDMRALGIRPIVVPRVPGGDEVVDDHQLVFTAEMARLGLVSRALTAAELWTQLDRALAGEREPMGPVVTPGADAVRALLEGPLTRLPRHRILTRGVRSIVAVVADRLRRR